MFETGLCKILPYPCPFIPSNAQLLDSKSPITDRQTTAMIMASKNMCNVTSSYDDRVVPGQVIVCLKCIFDHAPYSVDCLIVSGSGKISLRTCYYYLTTALFLGFNSIQFNSITDNCFTPEINFSVLHENVLYLNNL